MGINGRVLMQLKLSFSRDIGSLVSLYLLAPIIKICIQSERDVSPFSMWPSTLQNLNTSPDTTMHRLRDATCPSQPPTTNVTTCNPSLDLQIQNIVNSCLTSILDPSKGVRDNDDWNEHGQRTVVQHFRRDYSLNRTVPKLGGRHRLIIK